MTFDIVGSGGGSGTGGGGEDTFLAIGIISFLAIGLLLTCAGWGGGGGDGALAAVLAGVDDLLGPNNMVLAFSSSIVGVPFFIFWACCVQD